MEYEILTYITGTCHHRLHNAILELPAVLHTTDFQYNSSAHLQSQLVWCGLLY